MRPDEQRRYDELAATGEIIIRTSNIKTFRDCKRKLAFELVDGLVAPSKPAALLGSATHDLLEAHFEGRDPRFEGRPGKLAQALLGKYQWIPLDERLRVEELFLTKYQGWTYRGTPDLEFELWEGDTAVEQGYAEGWHIVDHKTSRDPIKWGLDPRTLPKDPQAVSYSWNSMLRTGADEVHLHWGYVYTQGAPKPFLVEATITRAQAFERIERNHETCREIVDMLGAARANEVEPDYSVCSKYGGCPFSQFCDRTKRSIASLMMIKKKQKEDRMAVSDVKDRWRKNRDKERSKQTEDAQTPKRSSKDKFKGKAGRDPDEVLAEFERQEAAEKNETSPKKRGGWKGRKKTKAEEPEDEDDEDDEEPEPPKKRGGWKGRKKTKAEEPEDEDDEDELEDRNPNAPEVDSGDEAAERVSKAGETKKGGINKAALREASAAEAAENEGKARALEAHEVLEHIAQANAEGEKELQLSTKRANDTLIYVSKKTLESLKAAGKIEYYIVSQTAYLRFPTDREKHGEVWLRALAMTEGDYEGADEIVDEYRKRFG